jgi:beta-aspartyl-dipeptidase (metallo-type)
MIYIDKVIGCKLAISDDRSSFPTQHEILRLINQVRLGGFTSGKGGILHIHLGALESRIDDLLAIAEKYPTLISYISPTHCSRTEKLFRDCLRFAKAGGMIDISTGGTNLYQSA